MLTALEIKNVESDGKTRRIGDGRGLYLMVRKSGSKSWVQRVTVDGRRTDIGLGGFPDVPLALARRKSEEIRAAIAEGRDPLAERRQPGVPTFRQAAEQYIADKSLEWRRPQQARDWNKALSTHAFPAFGNTRVDRVTRGSVLAVLRPLWSIRPAQARKLRQRIRAVFAAAQAHGHLDLNPAGEVIDAAPAEDPGRQGPFRGYPLSGRRRRAATNRGVGRVDRIEALFPVPGADGGALRRGAGGPLGRDRHGWADMDDPRRPDEGRRRASCPAVGRGPRCATGSQGARRRRVRLPQSVAGRRLSLRQDTHKDAAAQRDRGDRARIPNVVQDLVHGIDGHPLGRGRGCACPHAGQQHRAGIRAVRPVRAAARAHATVGRLRGVSRRG